MGQAVFEQETIINLLAVHGSVLAFAVPQLGQLNKTGVVHWYPGEIIAYLVTISVTFTALVRAFMYAATYFTHIFDGISQRPT